METFNDDNLLYINNELLLHNYDRIMKIHKENHPKNVVKYSQLQNRSEIIKKVAKLVNKLKFHQGTYFHIINLIDIIFYEEQKKNTFLRPEQIALGSVALCSKYFEKDSKVPNLRLIQNAFEPLVYYPIESLKKLEINCLKKINYNLHFYTCYDYLNFFICQTKNESKAKKCYEILNQIMRSSANYMKYSNKLLAIAILKQVEVHVDSQENTVKLGDVVKFVKRCLKISVKKIQVSKNTSKDKKKTISLYQNYSPLKKNRSISVGNSTCASSSEISMNLKKIKEESKLIKENLYSLLKEPPSKEETNSLGMKYTKMYLEKLKKNLNYTINLRMVTHGSATTRTSRENSQNKKRSIKLVLKDIDKYCIKKIKIN